MKPMLAAPVDDVSQLEGLPFPLVCSPKVDGIRCLTLDIADGENQCVPSTRNLLRVKNEHVYSLIAKHCPPGLDGEITFGDTALTKFNRTASEIGRHWGKPTFTYWVFDYSKLKWRDPRMAKGDMTSYERRLADMMTVVNNLPEFVKRLPYSECFDIAAVQLYHDFCVDQGYEGICIRTRHSPYKFGRSTMREGWLIKMKTFVDAEAVILDMTEKIHNTNPHMANHTTHKRRHSWKEGMVGVGMMGSLMVRDCESNVEFEVGSGFDDATRDEMWANKDQYVGRKIKYKHQPYGAKEKPRAPIFLGMRDDL